MLFIFFRYSIILDSQLYYYALKDALLVFENVSLKNQIDFISFRSPIEEHELFVVCLVFFSFGLCFVGVCFFFKLILLRCFFSQIRRLFPVRTEQADIGLLLYDLIVSFKIQFYSITRGNKLCLIVFFVCFKEQSTVNCINVPTLAIVILIILLHNRKIKEVQGNMNSFLFSQSEVVWEVIEWGILERIYKGKNLTFPVTHIHMNCTNRKTLLTSLLAFFFFFFPPKMLFVTIFIASDSRAIILKGLC